MKTNNKIKKMKISEFREKGYLQELNRRFLHPLGLALEVIVSENGDEKLGGIWDYRKDEEGIYYDIENSEPERKEECKRKYDFIQKEMEKRFSVRLKRLGFFVEPVDEILEGVENPIREQNEES